MRHSPTLRVLRERTTPVTLGLALALLYGCAVGPDYKRPAAASPEHYKSPVAAASSPAPDAWWTLFHDDVLNQLEEQVEISNQNLAQAQAAYAQAIALVGEQRAALFPSVSVAASATRFSSGGAATPTTTLGGGSTGVALSTTSASRSATSYQASAGANWELDVWGRLRRQLENARDSAQASAADLAAARLSAQGALATAYLQLREADAERRLLTATVDAYGRTLQITQNRYSAGFAPKTDVLQAETQLYSAQQQEAALILERVQYENTIAPLVGKAASDFTLAQREEWTLAAPEIPTGVPSTLLERRPDIVSAERLVAAANATIGAQIANYFPAFTLTGSYGFLSSAFSTLFEKLNESKSAALSGSDTLLDFGARREAVAAARAAYAQAVATYRQTVLTAFQSVENQLAAVDLLAKEYQYLRQASDAADETERLTLNEYKAGTVDYTTVVVAQTAALSARRSLAQVELAQQTAAVSLVTALGGGWIPATADATPAQAK
jgi:NodT family efflux transporter outer membrane factor (OMF) lipoprotein